MFVAIAIALVIIASVAVVAWPLYNHPAGTDQEFGGDNLALETLSGQRDAAYAAIKDLESDHDMGKLSDADYKSMRAKYEAKAVSILQELDGLTKVDTRHTALPHDSESIEQEVQRLRRGLRCPKCGTAHASGDAFCARCGTPLRGVRCPTCGTRAALGDKFCARCGSVLTGQMPVRVKSGK